MEYPSNEGGTGGKFRRRPARTPSKPYDRPPTALRGVRGGGLVTGERGGWMSKILDPASRLIANGASKLFASLFRKRLTAPPLEPGEDHSGADGAVVSQDTTSIPLSENRNGEIHNGGSSIDNEKNSSDRGIGELEQLFKQQSFTMVEFNRLEGLLRSRTIESSNANHEHSVDKKGKSVALASDDVPGSSRIEKRYLAPSNNLASQNPMGDANSPAEVAKAYIGLKMSKGSSLSGTLRDQLSNEETNLKNVACTPRRSDLSVAPTSVIRFSGIPELPQSQIHAYRMSKPVGRLTTQRMSRSPYFNVNRAASPQFREISRDGHSSQISSRWTPNSAKSCGKQAPKRGFTAIDNDYGSLGSIRRIRQKSNLVSPSRNYNSNSIAQKSLYLEEKKHDSTSSEPAEDGMEKNSIKLPAQSEKSHKLLQQLNKLIPSPKKKPSILKALVLDGPPSKLTTDMLNERAPRSTQEIKSFNFLSTDEAGKAATPSMRENMDEVSSLPQAPQANGVSNTTVPSKNITEPAYSGINSKAPQTNDVSNTIVPSKNITKPVPVTEKSSTSCSVSLSISRKAVFRMSAPEFSTKDSFDMDDDEDVNTNGLSIPSTSSPSDSTTKISVLNDNSSSKTSIEKLFSSSTGKDEKKTTINTQKETAHKPVDPSTVATNIINSSSDKAALKVAEAIRSEATQATSSNSKTTNSATLVKSEVEKASISNTLFSTTATFSTTTPAVSNPINSNTDPVSNMKLGLSSAATAFFTTMPAISNPINNNTDPVSSNMKLGLSSTTATFSTTMPAVSNLINSNTNPVSSNMKLGLSSTTGTFSTTMPAISNPINNNTDPVSSNMKLGLSSAAATFSTTMPPTPLFSEKPSSFTFGANDNNTTNNLGSSAFGSTSSGPNPFSSSSSSSSIFVSSASPVFSSSSASVFGSSASNQVAPPFQFGSSASSSAAPPFQFGSSASNSAAAPFQFGSSGSATVAPFTFNSSSSSGNSDQMSMDASNQAPSFPTFGSPAPSFSFQATGSFNPGGSFSLGSGAGGGDKSARKMIKVKRGIHGRK